MTADWFSLFQAYLFCVYWSKDQTPVGFRWSSVELHWKHLIQEPVAIENKYDKLWHSNLRANISSNFTFLIIALHFALPDLIYERRINVKAVIEIEDIILDEIYLITIDCDNNWWSYAKKQELKGLHNFHFFNVLIMTVGKQVNIDVLWQHAGILHALGSANSQV